MMYEPMSLLTLDKSGALPAQTIRALMRSGIISSSTETNIRPASLDLAVSDEVYHVEGIFQLRHGESVRTLLKEVKAALHTFKEPLEAGEMYVARLKEKLVLPDTIYGYCNPKSTSGRIDTHVRILADGVARYDTMSAGWSGELWIAINPKSFAIKLAPGQTLAQVRFFTADTRLSELELMHAIADHKLLWNAKTKKAINYKKLKVSDNDGSLMLSIDLSGSNLGFKCVRPDDVLDLSKVGYYDPRLFFVPIQARNGHVMLKSGEFYILSTLEAVRVPPELACEMAPTDEKSGDFRSHYAGFIDPGWGWGTHGEGVGRPLTLEVRPFEDLIVRHGQPIAKIRFEKMAEVPNIIYDGLSSNYTSQSGPKLAKQFA